VNTVKLLTVMCRWIARVAGALLVMLVVVIAIGEGMPNPFTQPPAVPIGFLALAMILIGILAGWRWELAGGVLSLAGWCLFIGSVVGLKHLNGFVLLLALPGILHLVGAWLRYHHNKSETP